MKGIFVTGTSTDVGKTYLGTLIARALLQQGISVIPRKPVESGCLSENNQLIPRDAIALKNAAGYAGSLADVCPYRFEPPVSPVRAARLAGQILTLDNLIQICTRNLNENRDFLLVEGAGGFYSPLYEGGLNADLAQTLGLPVILISQNRLGCINDILLCVEAIQSRQLTLQAIVLNQSSITNDSPLMDNLEDLHSLLDYPIFATPYRENHAIQELPEALLDILLNQD